MHGILELLAVALDLARRGWKEALAASVVPMGSWTTLFALCLYASGLLAAPGPERHPVPALVGPPLAVFVLASRGEAASVARALRLVARRAQRAARLRSF